MNRKLASISMVLSVLLFASVFVGSSSAADYTHIGVRNMDGADYQFIQTGQPVCRYSIYFYNVVGTTLSFNGTCYYPNGTVTKDNIYGNVSSGNVFLTLFIVCAGLSAHDHVVNSPTSRTINETVSVTSAGVSRSANHLFATSPYFFDIYWDQISGLMVRLNTNMFGVWWNFTLTATSVWHASVSPYDYTMLIVFGGMTAIIVIAILVLPGRIRK